MQNIVIFGASGHSKVVIDIIEKETIYNIVGCLDDDTKKGGSKIFEYPILGTIDNLPSLEKAYQISGGIITIGDNFTRGQVYERIKKLSPHFTFVNAIHPKAYISKGALLDDGTVVMANAHIGADCRIGKGAIVNTKASIDHDGKMGDFSSLAPGVIAGGNVSVGAYTAIGIGAIIKHNISIGAHGVIGAGACVLKDIPSHTLSYGVPAKVIKKRTMGEPYF